jgi:hypothetical protein
MKHLKSLRSCTLSALAVLSCLGMHAQVAISPSTAVATPNAKAMLDLNDISRGLLAPRFAYANRPAGPANSLLYYQTDSSTVTGEGRGYYYWDATIPQWVKASMGPGWRLGGNSGTNPATDFIGTINNVAMRIRTNGLDRMQLNTTGQVQVGTVLAATELLEVNGAMRVFSANPPATASDATPVEGAIRYNSVSGAHEGYVNQVPTSVPANQNNYVGWYQLENAFKTRVKQKYESIPVAACTYPAPNVAPTGTTFSGASGWLTIDVNGTTANPASGATLETPYSTFWEDGRHQYLYLSADMQALGVCPNTNINGIAFMTSAAGTAMGMRNVKVRMKNEGLMALTDFVNSGLVDCATIATYPAAPLVVTNGWNAHLFNVTPWQWAGVGNNMLVEFCFDNQDWTTNTPVYYENTAYNAMYGLYCDACGSPSGGSTCYYPGPCPAPTPNTTAGVWNAPAGPSSTSVGVICTGWGWNGFAGGGCAWTSTTSLLTCDGTFQYIGAQTASARRPILKINAQTTGIVPSYLNGNYLLASGEGLMIGDYPAWANSGNYGTCADYRFKGPGTISARSSVWGGAVLLSDHVFDNYYDGRIKPEDQQQAIGYRHYPLKEMTNYVEREHHLPTIAGRDDWKKQSGFSVDQLTNQLWVTVETQSLYIKELNDRMNALQDYLIEKRLQELKK